MPELSDPLMIMGVINITPDSFSDGGEHFEPDSAIQQALRAFELGADLVDLGAESTRPGATPVDPQTEWQRLAPVLKELVKRGLGAKVSIDTRHGETMRRAHSAGAKWFNNISGVSDQDTLRDLAADPDTRYIAMHMHGEPQTMQHHPLGGDVAVEAVRMAFAGYHQTLLEAGFSPERIYLDPGIGFGKSLAANLRLLRETSALARDYQLLLGISRKSFIGRLLDLPDAKQRDPASKLLEFSLWNQGADIIRTHEVGALARLRRALREEC